MPVAASLHYFSHLEEEYLRPPVVFIHGAGGNYLHWPPEVRRLPGQRIFAPDLPGHGFTERPAAAGLSLPRIADSVRQLLAALDRRPVLGLGHSAGAAILARLCIDKALDT